MLRHIPEEPVSNAAVWCRRLAVFSLPVAAIAVILARANAVEPQASLAVLGGAIVVALVALLLFLAACVVIWQEGRRGLGAALGGAFLAAVTLGYPAYLAVQAVRLPVLSDVSTDTADPPRFSTSRAAVAARAGYTPAGFDADTGVTSKDVVIDAVTGVFVRLYLPPIQAATDDDGKTKLPILVFFHGGYFVVGSASCPKRHRNINDIVARARLIAVSVDYRLAPEHLLPAAYDDSWAALNWALSGADPWLSEHGDTGRVFLAGVSAGGNIAHNMTIAVGVRGLDAAVPARIEGTILLHPSFCGETRMEGEPEEFWESVKKRWSIIFPDAKGGLDDPRMNPMAAGAPSLTKLACERMLVCAASEDPIRPRERAYYDAVKRSGWGGEVDWFESEGEGHAFFVRKYGSSKAVKLMDRVIAFLAGH
jgi:acetyl esterase/lipase